MLNSAMNKDFSRTKLLSMTTEKQFKVLFDLARFIELNEHDDQSAHFGKLTKYHQYLDKCEDDRIKILNKEFDKIKRIDYQFQIYLMNLERFRGQSSKDYQFMVNTGDKEKVIKSPYKIKCLLDSIRSAHNVGSFFRNAECFNIEELILTGLTPRADTPQVIKTAMGCESSVKSQYFIDPISYITEIKKNGYKVWSIETGKKAVHIHEVKKLPPKLILIFGHEQFGVSKELLEISDKIVDIRLQGNKNSLNVSVSSAVILNHLTNI